jgi:WD40 repeat protein
MPQSDRSDVFISYRRADVEFTKQVEKTLRATGREIWVDWEDIPPGIAGFTDEIVRGIEGADAVICVLSPSYMESEYCLMELEHAVKSNKRVVPIVLQKFTQHPPSGIGHINWIYFCPHAGQENVFDEAFPKVIAALEADFEHARSHTRYLLRAKEWDDKKRLNSFLMDGEEVDEAEAWLAKGTNLSPQPLALHTEYILASRQLETKNQRQARIYLSAGLGISIMLLIVAALLAVVAEGNRREAEQSRALAEAAQNDAESQAHFAEETALLSNSQLTLYRDNNTDLAIALALEAHAIRMEPSEEHRVLSEAAYAPGTRHLMTGHTGAVYGLALSADGSQAISGADDGTIRVWDIATGDLLRTFPADDPATADVVEGHTGIIWDIALSPDGKFVVSGGADTMVRIWNMATGEIRHSIKATEEGSVRAVAVSPDNKYILSSSQNVFSVQLWDVATGELVRELIADDAETDTIEGHSRSVRDIAFNRDNRTVVTGGEDGRALIWNWTNGLLLRKLLPGGQIYAVLFDHDSNRVFTAGNDRVIRYWNVVSAQQFPGIFEGHSASIFGIALSPDGDQIISASQDLSLRLWDVNTRKQLRRFIGHGNYAFKAAFLPDGNQFISASWDTTLRLWDIETREYFDDFPGHEGTIYELTFDKAGERLLSASGDHTARLWDTPTHETIQIFGTPLNDDPAVGHTDLVTNAAFSPDETQIVTTGYDNTVRLWDTASGALLHTFPADDKETDALEGHNMSAWSVTFLNDGKHVLSGGFDKHILLWNLETHELEHVFDGHTDGVLALATLSDGKRFISVSWDRTAILWDLETHKEIRRFSGHTNWIWGIALAPDEQSFLTVSADQTMILWDINTGKPIRRFLGHDDSVLSVAFSPDGKLAVSSGRDNRVLLWDVASGKPMRRFLGHTNWVRAIDFSRDGEYLVTGGNDRSILRWEIQTLDELIAWTTANRYIRELTCGERDRYHVLPLCVENPDDVLAPTATPARVNPPMS